MAIHSVLVAPYNAYPCPEARGARSTGDTFKTTFQRARLNTADTLRRLEARCKAGANHNSSLMGEEMSGSQWEKGKMEGRGREGPKEGPSRQRG
jgi:hypothetical protein